MLVCSNPCHTTMQMHERRALADGCPRGAVVSQHLLAIAVSISALIHFACVSAGPLVADILPRARGSVLSEVLPYADVACTRTHGPLHALTHTAFARGCIHAQYVRHACIHERTLPADVHPHHACVRCIIGVDQLQVSLGQAGKLCDESPAFSLNVSVGGNRYSELSEFLDANALVLQGLTPGNRLSNERGALRLMAHPHLSTFK